MINKFWYCNTCKKEIVVDFYQEFNQVCKKCLNPLELKYNDSISWNDFDLDTDGIMRYSDIIPVSKNNLSHIFDNNTPEFIKPIESKKIATKLKVESVHLLAPIYGPSGTFKDTEAAVMIAKCLDWKLDKLSWHSTGNTARAFREYAIRGKLKSDSYFPLSCIDKFKGAIYDPENILIAYNGPFQDISSIAKKRSSANSILHLSPLPWKLEGKATLAYNIFENIPNTNVIVQTIAGGYGIMGIQLGINRLKKLKLLNGGQHRYEIFQITGADTIAQLIPLKENIIKTDLKLPLNPFEPTLQSTNPLSTYSHLRKIIIETNSNINSVTTKEVIDNAGFFDKECHDLGIDISYEDEKSPYISWAGLLKRSKEKKLSSTDKIVIIITGARKRTGLTLDPNIIINKK